MGSGRRCQAICCAPTGNFIGAIAAIAISTSFWASCPRPSARICARSARRCARKASNSTGSPARDITEAHWDRFFDFYMDTGGRKWGHPYLTRDFFSRIGASMADQILLIMARRGGHYIAGALNLMGDRRSLRPQLGRARVCALPAFRDLLLSGDRFRHRARPCARSRPAPRASTNCCAATCRRRPTARITSPIRACAARWTSFWPANARR